VLFTHLESIIKFFNFQNPTALFIATIIGGIIVTVMPLISVVAECIKYISKVLKHAMSARGPTNLYMESASGNKSKV